MAKKRIYVDNNGLIVGMTRFKRYRKGRQDVEELKLRINTSDKIYRTSVSIDFHGFDEAFLLSIAKICEWTQGDSQDKKDMYATKDKYLKSTNLQPKESKIKIHKKPKTNRFTCVESDVLIFELLLFNAKINDG